MDAQRKAALVAGGDLTRDESQTAPGHESGKIGEPDGRHEISQVSMPMAAGDATPVVGEMEKDVTQMLDEIEGRDKPPRLTVSDLEAPAEGSGKGKEQLDETNEVTQQEPTPAAPEDGGNPGAGLGERSPRLVASKLASSAGKHTCLYIMYIPNFADSTPLART